MTERMTRRMNRITDRAADGTSPGNRFGPRFATWAVTATIAFGGLVGCGDRPQPKPPEQSVPAPPERERVARPTMEIADLGPISTPDSDPRLVQVAGIQAPKPASWIWQQPTMQFRTLQYAVPAMTRAAAAEFIVSAFLADGGPIDGNLERWRMQFQDQAGQPVDATVEVREIGGMRVHLIELRGAYRGMGAAAPRAGQAQMGAIVEADPVTIYLRLLGPAETVDAHLDAWWRLIEGLRRVE